MKEIDVLIPAIEKDLDVLPYAIDFARKNIRHPIGRFFIISPESRPIIRLAKQKRCEFVSENSVLPITKRDIHYCPKRRKQSIDRSGWLLQQFLKLSGDTLSSQEGYVVLDADTLLIRPHLFESGGKSVLFYRSLYFKPYFETYKRLLGEKAAGPEHKKFFVSHYMFFNKKRLMELKRLIEEKHKTKWYNAILNSMNKNQWDSFSEFETYGNFMLKNYPDEIVLRERRNLSLKRNSLKNISKMDIKKLATAYRSISFHSWNN